MKSKIVRNLLLVSGAVAASTAVSAASYSFEFLANDSSYEVEGIFTTADTLNAVGGFNILGISGAVTGVGGGAITGLVANPASPFAHTAFGFVYDNNLFPSISPQLSNPGVLFTTTSGMKWNLWGTSSTSYSLGFYSGNVGQVVEGTFTSAVPELESYAMMLAGLGLMGAIVRRRKNKSA